MQINLLTLKLGLLLFWSLWFSVVFTTNTFEGLKCLRLLPQDWKFASDNYTAITKATSAYSLPGWLNVLLFFGVILWQGLAVALFWRAFLGSLRAGGVDPGAITTAFAVGLALWAAFMLADEVFCFYEAQSNHMLIFISQLATFLGLYLLPN